MTQKTTFGAEVSETIGAGQQVSLTVNDGTPVDVEGIAGDFSDIVVHFEFDVQGSSLTGQVELYAKLGISSANLVDGSDAMWTQIDIAPPSALPKLHKTRMVALAQFNNGVVPAAFQLRCSNQTNGSIFDVVTRYRTVSYSDN